MKDFDFPSVTIVTVNFNGIRFLNNLFSSIGNLNYPKDKIRAIMVDNASTDGSPEFVGKTFPWVKILNPGRNLGYAGGNNFGFKAAQGKYVALINNDCIVDKNWLLELVRLAELSRLDVKTGAVSSKVLFYYSYMPVVVVSEAGSAEISDIKIESVDNASDPAGFTDKTASADKVDLSGIPDSIQKENIGNGLRHGISPKDNPDLLKSIKFLSGCPCINSGSSSNNSRWLISNYALIGFPVPDLNRDTAISMTVRHTTEKSDLRFYIKKINEKNRNGNSEDICHYEDLCLLTDIKIDNLQKKIKVIINRDIYIYRNDIINSCGLELNRSFYARDRGGNSFDLGQFNCTEEVFAPSGSSLLLSSEMLADTGVFDESFFTYYEDVDLFWRARLKGWKTFYAPDSVARHHHCGTNVEWSYGFTYHVLRNRLLAIFRCGWFKLFLKSYLSFVFSSSTNIIFYLAALMRGKKQHRPDIKARLAIFFELFYLLPKQVIPRFKIRHKKTVSDFDIKKMLTHF